MEILAVFFIENKLYYLTLYKFSSIFDVSEKLDEYRGITKGDTQLLSSPNFPLGYAVRGEVYTYKIRNIDPGGFVRLVFTDWDLSPHSRITVSAIMEQSIKILSVNMTFREIETYLEVEPRLLLK